MAILAAIAPDSKANGPERVVIGPLAQGRIAREGLFSVRARAARARGAFYSLTLLHYQKLPKAACVEAGEGASKRVGEFTPVKARFCGEIAFGPLGRFLPAARKRKNEKMKFA